MTAEDRYFADEQRTKALGRIAAAIEDSTKANREWFDMNRDAIESRKALDDAYLELVSLQVAEARTKLRIAELDADYRMAALVGVKFPRDKA
jgi:hypothetical protein